jgi:hypothetical protein
MGAQLYTQYSGTGKKLRPELINELDGWGSSIVQELEKTNSGGISIKGGIGAFFLSLQAKIKSEHTTREIIRKQIEPRLSELIDKINLIIADVEGREKKNVLVIIDDLDKPGLEQAKEIFYNNNEIRGIEKIGHLLHNLSVLEYMNDETWCDIHPTLEELLEK